MQHYHTLSPLGDLGGAGNDGWGIAIVVIYTTFETSERRLHQNGIRLSKDLVFLRVEVWLGATLTWMRGLGLEKT